ncbi:MAG: lysophospholipid acyltransferase family protein, partial [Planctomycetota bacterium]
MWSKVWEGFRGAALAVLVTVQILLFPACYVACFVAAQPLRLLIPERLFWRIEGLLYEHTIMIASAWTDLAGHELRTAGDDASVSGRGRTVVMVNHQRPSDIGVLMRALQRPAGFFRRNVWVMDWALQLAFFGWVSKCHGDHFLLQPVDGRKAARWLGARWNVDAGEQCALLRRRVAKHVRERGYRSVVLFPEGGFLAKRRAGSERYARRIGNPVPRHVAMPRSGAFEAAVRALGDDGADHVTVLDVTIGYRRPVTPLEHVFPLWRPRHRFAVHCERIEGFAAAQSSE